MPLLKIEMDKEVWEGEKLSSLQSKVLYWCCRKEHGRSEGEKWKWWVNDPKKFSYACLFFSMWRPDSIFVCICMVGIIMRLHQFSAVFHILAGIFILENAQHCYWSYCISIYSH